TRAAVEVYPVAGKKVTAAADAAGLGAFELAVLLVEGDNRPGLGAAIGRALADAGVNIAFLGAHALGRRFTAVLGFQDAAAAAAPAKVIKQAGKAAKRRGR